MPVEPSYMIDEPSTGPVASQTTVKAASSMSRAELAAGVDQKTIANDPLVLQLVAGTVSTSIFTCDDNYQVASVSAVAETLGGAGASVTVERLIGTAVPGAGVAQLSAAIPIGSNNGAVVHTVANGTVKANPDTFAKGDRVGIVMAGTLTALIGQITVTLKRV